MSAADAEAYVASVQGEQPNIGANDVIVYVDFRERRSRTSAASLSEALAAVLDEGDCGPVDVHIVRANLHVADALVCRVLSGPHVDRAADRLAAVMNEAVRVDGCGAVDVLDGPCLTPVPIFAYERKTVSDLVSSIQPGRGAAGGVPTTQRWLDQKARLSAFCNATGCLPALIIEGYMEHAQTGKALGLMSEKRAHGALHTANRRDGLPFWNSANTFDSARLLLRDARMVQEDRLLPGGWMRLGTIDRLVQQAADGASSLVVRKSDQATAESWWRGALCLVPGMSAAMAKAIALDWPSLGLLQRAWFDCVSTRQREGLVADVTWAAKAGGKTRRIGPVVSKRLLERMHSPLAGPGAEEPAPKRRSKK